MSPPVVVASLPNIVLFGLSFIDCRAQAESWAIVQAGLAWSCGATAAAVGQPVLGLAFVPIVLDGVLRGRAHRGERRATVEHLASVLRPMWWRSDYGTVRNPSASALMRTRR